MSTVPHELNWVKARSECSVGHVFSQLFIDTEQDINGVNLLPTTPGYPPPAFAVKRNEAGNAFVVFEAGNTNAMVKFMLARLPCQTVSNSLLRSRSIMKAYAN